jgi:hypothetical protein
MEIVLAGTGESYDVGLIFLLLAGFFLLLFLAVWLPSLLKQRRQRRMEIERMQSAAMASGIGTTGDSAEPMESEEDAANGESRDPAS